MTLPLTIRNGSRTIAGEKEACAVCGLHKEISEFHHLVTVAELTQLIIDHGLTSVRVVGFWLCPNHHAMFHVLNSSDTKRSAALYTELNAVERTAFKEIFTYREQVLREIFEGIYADQS